MTPPTPTCSLTLLSSSLCFSRNERRPDTQRISESQCCTKSFYSVTLSYCFESGSSVYESLNTFVISSLVLNIPVWVVSN